MAIAVLRCLRAFVPPLYLALCVSPSSPGFLPTARYVHLRFRTRYPEASKDWASVVWLVSLSIPTVYRQPQTLETRRQGCLDGVPITNLNGPNLKPVDERHVGHILSDG